MMKQALIVAFCLILAGFETGNAAENGEDSVQDSFHFNLVLGFIC